MDENIKSSDYPWYLNGDLKRSNRASDEGMKSPVYELFKNK